MVFEFDIESVKFMIDDIENDLFLCGFNFDLMRCKMLVV